VQENRLEHILRTIMRPLGSIQILRALAALAVVLFHMQGELAHRGFDDPLPSLNVGAFGVDLFFVISGFIMVYSSGPFFAQRVGGWRFFTKRIIRIAPLYWIFTTISAAIAVALSRYPGHADYSMRHIAASYLFFPAARPEDGAMLPTCPTGWTLNFEMFFYVCFAFALQWRRPVVVAAVCAALALLIVAGFLVAMPKPIAFLANPIIAEFCLGMLLAQLFLSGFQIAPVTAAVLLLVGVAGALLYTPYVDSHSGLRPLAWGLSALAIVAASILYKATLNGLVARALETLGDASYSLYLVHTALFISIYTVLSKFIDLHRIPAFLYGIGLVGASVVAALGVYKWIELPITRHLNRLYKPSREKGSALESGLLPR
jgi:exopolysaccharide production protein ExoZ